MTSEIKIFANLRPEDLVRHASSVIQNPLEADALSKQRWSDTWGHQAAYTEDLIAYLYRPSAYLRRLDQSRCEILKLASGLSLGDLLREASEWEVRTNLDDPLVALRTLVQAALPTHPKLQKYVNTLEEASLRTWAETYAEVFNLYGLELREGHTWLDLAEVIATLVEGALLRGRSRSNAAKLSNGSDVVYASIVAMMPWFFGIAVEDLSGRLRNTSRKAG